MENILGQPSRFIYCTRFTVLTDELSKLTKDTSTLVISCLASVVSNLTTSADVKTALETAMTSLGSMLRELVSEQPGLRVIIVHCTPRGTPDFETHSTFAMVISKKLDSKRYLSDSVVDLLLLELSPSIRKGQGNDLHVAMAKRV
jgi:hypothetical protein